MMDMGQTLGPIISGIILAMTLQYSSLFYSLGFLLIFSTLVFTLSKTAKNSPAT
jgi:hypothetical protein